MTLAHMKREIARIKRSENIDFEKLAYEEATERHWNRLSKIRLAWAIEDKKKASGKKDYNSEKFLSDKVIAQRLSELDRSLAGDTPKKWRKDQATIEAYHLDKYGHLDRAKRFEAFGVDEHEMLRHFFELYLEGVRKAKEQPKMQLIEQFTEQQNGPQWIARPREKPVRLHPYNAEKYGGFGSFLAGLPNCYTPEFADGRMEYDLAQFYPYDDYPEFDGYTVIEFYDKNY